MKPTITVLSLGPCDPSLLTIQTSEALLNARKLILRTSQHPVAAWLDEKNIAYATMDALYDQYWDFDELHFAIAQRLWQEAASVHVTYAVLDATADGSVAALEAAMPEDGKLTRMAGLSMADAYLASLPAGLVSNGFRMIPAMDCERVQQDPRMPLLITELNSPVMAGMVKLWLTDLYDDEMPVWFFPAMGKVHRKPVQLPLMELDRQRSFDHTTAVFVPAAPMRSRKRFCFADLVEILAMLRGDNGCPWDREQTHESLRKYLIEEAYETVGAIDEGDIDHLADELGDVLLQVVFHADVGKSHGDFTISDVTTNICRKMIYRHGHIFGTDNCKTADEVSQNWERLKKAEKGLTTQASVLADVSRGLPALMRAHKVQKKAADVGFDWDSAQEALPKVHEEADEVSEELEHHRDPGEELGDLLFSCVNVSRLCGLDAEELLKNATDKFISRFTAMENLINSAGKSLEGLTLSEMDVYWNQVKTLQKNAADV